MTSIMLGVTTFNRPAYLEKNLRAIREFAAPLCDQVIIHNDGSEIKYHGEYGRAYKKIPNAIIQNALVNQGVAASKNAMLRQMLKDGADWLFLCEDDILVRSPLAITGYVDACKKSGLHHLSFAHHGPANMGGPVEADDIVRYYPHSVGAWTIYSRECLERCGLFDEKMVNAFEHVEHDLRLFQMGYTPNCGAHRFPDAVGAEHWLTEIPGSLEKSSIRPRSDWQSNIRNSLRYWHDTKPDTFDMLFGEKMPLHAYALRIME